MHEMEILSDKKALCHDFVFLRNPLVMVWVIIEGCFGSDGKEPACNEEDLGSIPGSGRTPGVENGNPTLAWRIPWTEEPGGLQSTESQRVGRS